MLKRNEWRWVERDFASDVRVLLSQRKLAWQLYLADIAESKRNSGLGLLAPFVSVIIHVLLLGSVMGLVFNEPLTEFIPFFAISFSIWQGISIFVSDISYANDRTVRYLSFPNVSGFISSLISTYEFATALALKICGSLVIVLFVNPAIVLDINLPAFGAGLLILTLVLISWSLPLAYLFDRVRILRGFLPQILFAIYLVTPILWAPDRLTSHRWLIELNPVYHLVELARAPFMSGTFSIASAAIGIALIALGIAMSYLLFPANRSLVVYRWVA